MTTKEAGQKICPLNKELCIVDLCPKWEFTKTRNIVISQP